MSISPITISINTKQNQKNDSSLKQCQNFERDLWTRVANIALAHIVFLGIVSLFTPVSEIYVTFALLSFTIIVFTSVSLLILKSMIEMVALMAKFLVATIFFILFFPFSICFGHSLYNRTSHRTTKGFEKNLIQG